MYYVFDDSCLPVQYLAPTEGMATPIMQRIVADSQPMVTEWLCRVWPPHSYWPRLSNWPDRLDPCDMAGCQGRVAHHYWAMMTNITDWSKGVKPGSRNTWHPLSISRLIFPVKMSHKIATLSGSFQDELLRKECGNVIKGAPTIECWTYSRLVSPGLDPEKKNGGLRK